MLSSSFAPCAKPSGRGIFAVEGDRAVPPPKNFRTPSRPTTAPVKGAMLDLAERCSMAISSAMCGRVIQSSGPLRYAIDDGMNVHDSRVHNYPPKWNAAPSQELLVIRRNRKTGEVSLDPLRWGLIPYWRSLWWPQADQRQE